MIRPKKIISGGQTGVDRIGLEVAKKLCIPTGGFAPLDYRTEEGSDYSLIDFGLKQHFRPEYKPRTIQNVKDADITVWFGNDKSPGGKLTIKTAQKYNKPFLINPNPYVLRMACKDKIVNIAGNRLRNNPEATKLAERTLIEAFSNQH